MSLAEGTSRFRGRQRTGRTIARPGTKSREEEWTSAPATQETSETLAPQVRPPEEARTPRKDRGVKDYRAPNHISKTVLSTVHLGPPKRNRTWAGGPTVLLDNRESRPFRHLPASFVLRNRLAPCPPGPATPYQLDGWSERSRLSPSQGWEVAGSGG